MTTTIAQVGVRGFGRVHLQRIDRLTELDRVRLVATADPGGPLDGSALPWYPTLAELLETHSPDITSIATPIKKYKQKSIFALIFYIFKVSKTHYITKL